MSQRPGLKGPNNGRPGAMEDIAHAGGDQASSRTTARPREGLLPHNRWVVLLMQVLSFLLVAFFFIIPAILKAFPSVISHATFLNWPSWPPVSELANPSGFGLNATRNFRLDTAPDVSVGVWHVLPAKLAANAPLDQNTYPSLLSRGFPIIIYLHGNSGNRAGGHRLKLYQLLSSTGFHVIAFDYRGYGDSEGWPSEDGLVEDTMAVFEWVRRQSGTTTPIYIWGHSLGTAIGTHAAMKLSENGADYQGLILEAPFNNFIDAANDHPFSLPMRFLPWFTWCFIEGIKYNNIRMTTDENIAAVTVPTLILHAKDDGIVPYYLGRKLYEAAVRTKRVGAVQFVDFDAELGYGHRHIHRDPNLIDIITKFTGAQLKA